MKESLLLCSHRSKWNPSWMQRKPVWLLEILGLESKAKLGLDISFLRPQLWRLKHTYTSFQILPNKTYANRQLTLLSIELFSKILIRIIDSSTEHNFMSTYGESGTAGLQGHKKQRGVLELQRSLDK